MKQTGPRTDGTHAAAGFTLVELLVVVGIIALLGAVAAPAIISYLRTYQIRAGTHAVAGDIQAARNRAIAKNVNMGVVFVVEDATTYWTHVEDDQSLPKASGRQALDMTAPEAEQSTQRRLPDGVEFALAGADCPSVTGFAPADSGFRFNRLGAWCDPTGGSLMCPAVAVVGGATVNAVHTTGTGSTICLLDRRSNLTRDVTVTPGGRVRFQQ
ncbi:MAG TPA: prepilin-type N-terminal cleavage/methylation domain-containing protein [Vicinamibacteria bacterium]|nr:prepilin-type N-terminal cleavage/methylation domain-containing protein [Vicinamibacteria bacterium]